MTRRECLVFDLDGVLTRKDTFTALIWLAVKRRPWRVPLAVGAMVDFMCHRHDIHRRSAAVQRMIAVLLADISPERLRRWCARVGRTAASPRWMRTELVEEYQSLQNRGYRIVIATATDEGVARAVLEAYGLRAEAILGSRITLSDGRATLTHYNYGPRKLSAIRAAGYQLGEAGFYTDSASDIPTAAEADWVVLIEPTQSTVAAFSAADIMFTILPQRQPTERQPPLAAPRRHLWFNDGA